MKKFSKLLALCLALLFLIVCLAFGGCKKMGTQGSETGGDSATTTAEHNTDTTATTEHNTDTTTTTEHNTGTTTSSRVGDEVVLPGDDDVVIQIEGTTTSSTVGSSKSSGTSSTKNSSSGSTTKSSSQNQANTQTGTTYSRAASDETPVFGKK